MSTLMQQHLKGWLINGVAAGSRDPALIGRRKFLPQPAALSVYPRGRHLWRSEGRAVPAFSLRRHLFLLITFESLNKKQLGGQLSPANSPAPTHCIPPAKQEAVKMWSKQMGGNERRRSSALEKKKKRRRNCAPLLRLREQLILWNFSKTSNFTDMSKRKSEKRKMLMMQNFNFALLKV